MSLFAQHGWGKKTKIQEGIRSGLIQGVVMSPRDESPSNLKSFLRDIRMDFPDVMRLVDPQLYAATIWPANAGKLPLYDHFEQRLTPASFSVARIRELVQQTLCWQRELDVSAVVSPTVMVDDLSSQWAQISMMLAQETASEQDGNQPLLISLVIGEDSLRQQRQVDLWLNDLTELDVQGFYLVVKRTSESYRQHFEPEVLSQLLRVCYSLAELNEYRVVVGYADFVTLLLHVVGVEGTGAGWSGTLKQFNLRRFQPATGGSRARPRYSSFPMLNSIYMSELDAIHNAGLLEAVLSGTPFDERFRQSLNPENVPWQPDDAALHHWSVLADYSKSQVGLGVKERLDYAQRLIANAAALYTHIEKLVPFSSETGSSHLDQWLEALKRFKSEVIM